MPALHGSQHIPVVPFLLILVALAAALAIGFAIGRWQRSRAPEPPASAVAVLVSTPASPPSGDSVANDDRQRLVDELAAGAAVTPALRPLTRRHHKTTH